MPKKSTITILGETHEIIEFPEYTKLEGVRYDQGGMTDDEFRVCKMLDFSLLSDERYSEHKYQITNAYHDIQQIFMSRVCIRLTGGEYWMKFEAPYEEYETEIQSTKCQEKSHKDFIANLQNLYTEFIQLEPYHPSHRDDLIRAIREFEDILCILEKKDL